MRLFTKSTLVWKLPAVGIFLLVFGVGVQAFSRAWFFPQVVPVKFDVSGTFSYLGRPEVYSAVRTSLQVGVVTTAVSLLLALPAAWQLATKKLPGRRLLLGVLMVPQLVPPITAGMGLTVAALSLGAKPGLLAVIVAHTVPVLPFVIGLCTVAFSRLDLLYVDAAAGLGCSPWQTWSNVVWPFCRTGIGVAAYVGFVVSWSQYLLTLFVGGGTVVTLPMLVLSAGSGSDVSLFATLTILMSILPAGLYLVIGRKVRPEKNSLSAGEVG